MALAAARGRQNLEIHDVTFPAVPVTDGKQKEHGRPRRPKHVHGFPAEGAPAYGLMWGRATKSQAIWLRFHSVQCGLENESRRV